ncbi:MAG: hypothetical protein VW421_01960 [Gammaproteobacteria bacterium]|jgi:hypothetical protein
MQPVIHYEINLTPTLRALSLNFDHLINVGFECGRHRHLDQARYIAALHYAVAVCAMLEHVDMVSVLVGTQYKFIGRLQFMDKP